MADHDHGPLTFPSRPDFGPSPVDRADHHDEDRDTDGAVFDALADMFLGAESDPFEDEFADSHRWSLEVLVMGHLPVRARPWASQYASARATRDNTSVALVRIDGGYGSVELFGSARGSLSVASAPSLAGAIERAGELVDVCLVLLDDEPQTRLLGTQGVDAVTIIVGANDAAVVDAYREIKSIAMRSGGTLPRVRVGVMGADDEQADHVVAKLAEASETFLGQRVESTTAIQRMGPTHAVSLFGDRVDLNDDEILAMILRDEIAPQPTAAEQPPVPVTPPAPAPTPTEVEIKPVEVPVMLESRVENSADASTDVKFSPGETLDLLAFVDDATPIGVECPYAGEAVLAIDARGALLVLREADTDGEALLKTMEWAEAHRSILSLATNGRVRTDLDVRAHAFVRSREQAGALCELLPEGLEVHLVTPVPEGARFMSTRL